MCLAGAVVASWSLTQEVGGSMKIFRENLIVSITIYFEMPHEMTKSLPHWAKRVSTP